jgi:hypothetical protein
MRLAVANTCQRSAGSALDHLLILAGAGGFLDAAPPEAYKAVPRRVRGLDGQIRNR